MTRSRGRGRYRGDVPAGHVPALASALDEVIIDLVDCEVRVRAERLAVQFLPLSGTSGTVNLGRDETDN